MGGRRTHYGDSNKFVRGHQTTGKTLKTLRELGSHVVKAAKIALKEGAEIIVADAKSRCPVKTGKLRDSIKAVSEEGGTVYRIEAGASRTFNKVLRDSDGRVQRDSAGNPMTVEQSIDYGQIVEFSPKINKPFLYPAFEAHAREAEEHVKEAIRQAINQHSG